MLSLKNKKNLLRNLKNSYLFPIHYLKEFLIKWRKQLKLRKKQFNIDFPYVNENKSSFKLLLFIDIFRSASLII